MEKKNLKVRLINDDQIFENLPANEAGIMTSSGCGEDGGGCGCGSGGYRLNFSRNTSVHGPINLGSYSWEASGNVDVHAEIEVIYASGNDKQYRFTGSAVCSISLKGNQSSTLNNHQGTSYIGGNTVVATGTIGGTTNGTTLNMSGTIGTGRFIVIQTDYDKDNKLYNEKTLLDSNANIVLTASITYTPMTEDATITALDLKLS